MTKINVNQSGSARILSKALQSAYNSVPSRREAAISEDNRKCIEQETASVSHWPNTPGVMGSHNEYSSPTSNVQPISSSMSLMGENSLLSAVELSNECSSPTANFQPFSSPMSLWIEDSLSSAINETLSMVPSNDIDEWAKENRLRALKQLKSGYSSDCLSSTNSSVLNEELSPGASDWQVSSDSPQNFQSSKSNAFFSKTRYDLESSNRPIIQQREEKLDLAHKFYHIKESRPKDSRFEPKSRNCCEPKAKNKNYLAKLPSYDVSFLMSLKSTTGFFDSHCHLDLLFNDEQFSGSYADYITQHKDSYPDSYNGCIAVFCKPWTFEKDHMWRKLLDQNNVWGAFGCHPKQAKCYNHNIEKYLERALHHPKVRALGEIGLDYSKGNKRYKKEQHYAFRRQLKIAQRRKLRVVIHCREADDDAMEILHEILPKDAIFHLHCFTGSWEKAQEWMQNFPNVYIGITNLVTFPSAVETHEVARRMPLNRLLLETDAPFFVPKKAPRGTKHAHPGMAIHVAAQIAALKNIPIDEVLRATSNNTRFVYKIS